MGDSGRPLPPPRCFGPNTISEGSLAWASPKIPIHSRGHSCCLDWEDSESFRRLEGIGRGSGGGWNYLPMECLKNQAGSGWILMRGCRSSMLRNRVEGMGFSTQGSAPGSGAASRNAVASCRCPGYASGRGPPPCHRHTAAAHTSFPCQLWAEEWELCVCPFPRQSQVWV